MPELASIYDAWYFQPAHKIKDSIGIWTGNKWQYYICDYLNQIAPSRSTLVDMVAVITAGAPATTTLAANGTLQKSVVNILQLDADEFTMMRYEPLDLVEGAMWELGGQQLHKSKNVFSRCGPNTREWDPFLTSTTFWVLGSNHDVNLEVFNPLGYALPQARFLFWGCRMKVALNQAYQDARGEVKARLERGELKTVKEVLGPTTFVPAEGRG